MSVTGFNRRRRQRAKKLMESGKLGRETQEVNPEGYEVEKEQTQEEEKEQNLEQKTVTELREIAQSKGITGYTRMKKEELINALGDD